MSKLTRPLSEVFREEYAKFDREIGGYLDGIPVQQTLFDTSPHIMMNRTDRDELIILRVSLARVAQALGVSTEALPVVDKGFHALTDMAQGSDEIEHSMPMVPQVGGNLNRPQIIVRSHAATERMQPYDLPWACISITGPETQPAKVPTDILFNDEMARQVLTFAKEVWPKVKVLHIHCWAGISRSSGTAAALSKIYTGTDGVFVQGQGKGDNGSFYPNSLVYNTILKEHVLTRIAEVDAEEDDE